MALTIEDLALALGVTIPDPPLDPDPTTAELTRLLALSIATVEKYAPLAPLEVKDEAVIRLSGYLYGQRPERGLRGMSVGPVKMTFESPSPTAFTSSGAKNLCAPFRIHRAGGC